MIYTCFRAITYPHITHTVNIFEALEHVLTYFLLTFITYFALYTCSGAKIHTRCFSCPWMMCQISLFLKRNLIQENREQVIFCS